MKRIIATLMAFAAAAAACLAQPKLEIFHSKNLHCDDTVAVYSPASMQAQKDLPTLFLLHGYSGNWRDWGKGMDLQALCDRTGWRIITPDGFYKSWYLNNADKNKMQWRTFFWEECWPAIAKQYGLNPEKTFIAGLSMGGHGAMNIFLDHPERFKGAGSMSGVLDLRYGHSSAFSIPEILGKNSIRECDSESAVTRLESFAALGPQEARSKLLIIGCGTDDKGFYPASRIFEARCHELGLKFMSVYRPGGHEWGFWTYILPYYIGWFSETLEK